MPGSRVGSPFERLMLHDIHGEECWSARDLHEPMGYEKWERFEVAINRAMEAARNSGLEPLDHFRGASKVIAGGRWGKQQVADYRLTRYACYLVAMNGDPRKPEIAAAQTYFAVQTRNAEVAQASAPVLPQDYEEALVELLSKVRENKALAAENKVLAPKAGKWDELCNSEGLIEMGTAAHALSGITGGLGRTKFMDLLRSPKVKFLQTQNPRIPYQEHTAAGRAKVKFVPAGYKTVEQTFLTPVGLDWLVDKLGGDEVAA
ncbi:phage antirepressor KilAC domain-containing protein [Streptomyces yangpuensis]|uniref:phage antirepressor KilAC domain-containing protein n=1 Tax=Streptomyces yangpuensis TaxID=1648182 RepID=UPI0035DC2626